MSTWLVLILALLIVRHIWRANKRWSHAERIVSIGKTAICRGESPLSVGAEMVANSQANECEEELKILADEQLPDLARIWESE